MLLIADPVILAIPVKENFDPMVKMENYGSILTDEWHHIPILDYKHKQHTFVRKQVAEMLIQAQSLMPEGWHIKLVEGYRSEYLQKRLFDFLFAQRKKDFPNLSYEALFNKTIEVVSPIINLDNSINIFPHGTGAAVDIKLVDDQGKEIDLGPFPEEDNEIDPQTFHTYAKLIPNDQQEKRHILCQTMTQVGFVNYSYEWWHYSYGDRYWAHYNNQSYAIYDLIDPIN